MPTPFQATLLPGSYRGVPFITEENGGEIGRRGQVHEYWGRNTPYAEDGGKRARRLEFRCFVLGDDCALQRDLLLTALETPGPGLLVHPSMGSMMMQPDPLRPCRFQELWGENRRISFELAFVEPGQLSYPVAGSDTQANSATAGSQVQSAGNQDFSGGANGSDNPNTVAAGNQDFSGGATGDEAGQVIPIPPADEAGQVIPIPPATGGAQAGAAATPPLAFTMAPDQFDQPSQGINP